MKEPLDTELCNRKQSKFRKIKSANVAFEFPFLTMCIQFLFSYLHE